MKTLVKHACLWTGLALAAILLPVWAAGQEKTHEGKKDGGTPPKGQRVFYASHSLMWYAPKPLGELADAAGIKDHKLVGLQMLGASKTLQHWNLLDAKNQAKQALKKGEVDVFVMSPIQFPDEGIDNFVKLGLDNNPNMRFLVQISWGGWDIDNQDFPKGATNNVDRNKNPEQLKKLYERNIKAAEEQADAINKKVGKKVVFLVPSAQAVVAIRTKIYNKEIAGLAKQDELFSDAMSHPAAPLEALNTYLHYAMIYGQSPVGLPMPSLLNKAKKVAWDEKFNRALQELAWETVSGYPYSGVGAAQDKGEQPPGGKQAAAEGGSGPYKAVVVGEKTLATHAIYRPKDLAPFGKDLKLPIVLWGNGGGANSSSGYTRFLLEIASHGFLVVAIGPVQGAAKDGKGTGGKGGGTKSSQLLDGLDWAIAQNEGDGDYKGKLNPKKVAAMGHSLGGLQALEVSTDARITTTVCWNSGVLDGGKSFGPKISRADLNKLHGSLAYFNGGPKDIATPNAEADFQAIKSLPVFFASCDVGHGGTFGQPNGGVYGEVGVAWLKWQLKEDKEAAKMFLGDPPGLAVDKKWTVKTKNLK
jgi:dienelactone hydrolase